MVTAGLREPIRGSGGRGAQLPSARSSYDDEAGISLAAALRARPGVERVLWEDRETLHAPTLCAEGILAAAARALLDPRVRQGDPS